MKKYLFVLFWLASSLTSRSQQRHEESIYSRFLHAPLDYTVFLPADRDSSQALPVLYAFKYGMVDGDYIAAQLKYFQSAHYTLPPTIVVIIQAEMDRIGYLYTSGQLTATGRNLVECLQQELIPKVEKKYNTSSFRSYLGHSYAASYGNYLFQYKPGLFNGYLLMASEQVDPGQPPFEVTPAMKDWYNEHYSFYYVGIGEHDMERRIGYARDISTKLSSLDPARFFFRHDTIHSGNHTNILTLTFQSAIEHVYQLYNPYLDAGHPSDVARELEETVRRVKEVYGITPQRTPIYYNRYCQLAIANKDPVGLKKVLAWFDKGKGKSWYYMQFGHYCSQLKMQQEALDYTQRAIKAIEQKELNTDRGRANLIACYTQLANLHQGDTTRAWQYLQKAKKIAIEKPFRNGYQPVDVYYEIGKWSILNQQRVREGLQSLLTYQELAKDVSPDAHGLDYKKTEFYISKCYTFLKDYPNARRYLELARQKSPNNAEIRQAIQDLR